MKCEIVKVGTITIVDVETTGDKLQDMGQHGIQLDGWVFGRWADMRGSTHPDLAWDLWDNDDDGPTICGWTIKQLLAASNNPSEFMR